MRTKAEAEKIIQEVLSTTPETESVIQKLSIPLLLHTMNVYTPLIK